MARIISIFILCMLVQATPALAGDQALKDNMALAQKLEDIVAPLLVENSGLCGANAAPYLGAEFLTLDGVSESYREPVARLYQVGEWPTVTIVGKGSPAFGVLQHGDMVSHIDGQKLSAGNQGQDEVVRAIAATQGRKPLVLRIDRNGQTHNLDVMPALVCAPKIRLGIKETKEVWSEAGRVYVSKGILRGDGNNAQIAARIKEELRVVTQ